MVTKIFELKFDVATLLDYVLLENAVKVFDVNPEANAAAHDAYEMIEDDVKWFNRYLKKSMVEIGKKLFPLNKTLDDRIQVDPLFVTVRLRLVPYYRHLPELEAYIQNGIVAYICYAWYAMKNLGAVAENYATEYNDVLENLKWIAVQGPEGKCTATRGYDMGMGSYEPRPYGQEEVVIRDIKWKTKDNYAAELYRNAVQGHLPHTLGAVENPTEAGNTRVEGPTIIETRFGNEGDTPENPNADTFHIGGNGGKDVVIRNNNETNNL